MFFAKTAGSIRRSHLEIWISGFYNRQISADEMDDKRIKGSKEKAVAVGPIVTVACHPLEGSLKTLFVLDAENNPEGTVTTLILNFLF
jgi:hypothetical protein